MVIAGSPSPSPPASGPASAGDKEREKGPSSEGCRPLSDGVGDSDDGDSSLGRFARFARRASVDGVGSDEKRCVWVAGVRSGLPVASASLETHTALARRQREQGR